MRVIWSWCLPRSISKEDFVGRGVNMLSFWFSKLERLSFQDTTKHHRALFDSDIFFTDGDTTAC